MDKTILLQKQVRENSEDLQKEFRDMEAWEEQMKKKDLEIRSLKDDQVLPPVRSKKKKKTPTSEVSKDEKPSKTKRIGASDYDSWNKFDADKACKEIDGDGSRHVKEEKIYEIPSKEELEKEHTEATKLKEEGNALVQKQDYAKAVNKYSEAIKIFPYDAVFYANRALCQLKLDNLYSAESDCTNAIQLDETYVKAYHRRATARIELKRYKDAEKDIEIVLKLDPSNKEAACMLVQVQKKIEKLPKPMIISGEEKNDNYSIEKKIGEKLLKKTDNVSLQDKNLKPDKQNKSKSLKVEQISTLKSDKPVIKQIIRDEEDTIEKKKEQFNTQGRNKVPDDENDGLPPWLPKLKKGISIIQPLTEAPHRQSQTLKRIPIKEVPVNESIFKDIEIETHKSVLKEETVSKIHNTNESKNKSSSVECDSKGNIDISESLPPPPKSSVRFLINWRKNTSLDFRYEYLKQIAPNDLPNIFKEAMESNIFSEILCVLNTKFIPNDDKVYDYLNYLAKVKRFRALILFMTQADKAALKNLLECCKTKESKTEEEIQNLYSAYEL